MSASDTPANAVAVAQAGTGTVEDVLSPFRPGVDGRMGKIMRRIGLDCLSGKLKI